MHPPGGANRPSDCDGCRPDTLGGEVRGDLFVLHVILHLQRGAVQSLAVPSVILVRDAFSEAFVPQCGVSQRRSAHMLNLETLVESRGILI